MKNYGISADSLSSAQPAHPKERNPKNRDQANGAVGEHTGDELATSLAMMHATLESTTDAIVVTDEANYVREFNEKYRQVLGNSASHDGISSYQ
jgi:PAS domain-containing protein